MSEFMDITMADTDAAGEAEDNDNRMSDGDLGDTEISSEDGNTKSTEAENAGEDLEELPSAVARSSILSECDIAQQLNEARAKYDLVVKRCEEMEQANQRLVEKILETRDLVESEDSDRQDLMQKLDDLGDTEYKCVPVVMPPAEEAKKRDRDSGSTTYRSKRRRSKRPHGKADSSGDGSAKRGRSEALDPHLPKRPQNPFFQFCQEQRDRVQKEYQRQHNVQLTKKELAKVMAEKWRGMGSEQKQIYNLLFEEEKKRYNEAMYKYREGKKGLAPSSDQN